ncbi:MAG: caspase family protein, partial [Acidobacteriota bacterium]
MRTRFLWLTVFVVLAAIDASAQRAGHRRALLIGINDYSASKLSTGASGTPPPDRDWVDLRGAINDVAAMKEMLVLLHGFDRKDILTLTDQAATRAAILQSLETHLVMSAAKDDILFFYFAGHGSQVKNTLSSEPDKLDETLVPADSRLGVRDIRDKELRLIFNRILDRGAHLTVLLDSCHSGSGARGLLTGARPRGVDPDPRDIADATRGGLPPESRGALILSAAQDFDAAWETRDAQGNMHGAFSWAWLRAMRDSTPGESAAETFLRASARMRAETPYQEPVMAGQEAQRLSPFLGGRTDRRGQRTVVGVERVHADGTVTLQGGWATGLSVGSELRLLEEKETTRRLTVTAIRGLGQSEARMQGSPTLPPAIRSGALLEVVGWAVAPDRPLRVWAPRVPGNVDAIRSLARRLSDLAVRRGVRWLNDPSDVTPTHLLRRGNHDWELLKANGALEHLGPEPSDAISAVARMHAGSSLFVQFPSPATLIDAIDIGPGTDREGIVLAARPEEADYILVGRYTSRRLSYAWMRPLVHSDDRRKSGLPLRTTWIAEDARDETLRD